MRACQGIRPNTATEQRDACYRRAKTGNETHISFPSLQFRLSLSLSLHLAVFIAPLHSSAFHDFALSASLTHSVSFGTLIPFHSPRTSLIFDSLTFTPIHKQTKRRGRIHVSE